MKPGDLIWVRVFKADGTPYRSWQALVESITDGCVVTLTRASNPVYLRDRVYAQAHHMRNYYWPGRRHDLLEVYEPDGRLHELYVNIASPVELLDGEIRYIDHELDVQMYTGDVPRVIDQDEFAEAAEQFGYTEQFMQESYALAESLLDVVANWRPLGMETPGF